MRAQIVHTNGVLPSFDVASVRPWDPNTHTMITLRPLGSSDEVTLRVTPRVLVRQAYGISVDSELVGGEAWSNKEVYEIHAKVSVEDYAKMQKMKPAERILEVQLMLQRLLAER